MNGTTGRERYSAGLIGAAQTIGALDVTVHVVLAEREQRRSRSVKIRSLLSPLPAMSAASRVAANRIRACGVLHGEWDVVVVDHLQLGWLIPEAKNLGLPVVFVAHNHETTTARSFRPAAWWMRLPWLVNALKVERLERASVRAANVTTVITEGDVERFVKSGARCVRVLAPVALRRPIRPNGRLPDARRVMHLGSFDWAAKRDNLRDLIRASGQAFVRTGTRLVIVGPGDPRSIFAKGASPPFVDFVGEISEGALSGVLATCRAAIVAEPRGGGFKMKLLDLIAAGLPLFVLRGSATGLSLVDDRNCRLGSSLEELVTICVRELHDNELLERIRSAAVSELDAFRESRASASLLDAIELATRRDNGSACRSMKHVP